MNRLQHIYSLLLPFRIPLLVPSFLLSSPWSPSAAELAGTISLLLCGLWRSVLGSGCRASRCCVRLSAPSRVLFSIIISFSHPFSRRRSATSRSNSSARPVRSDTERSKLIVFSFFLVRKRAMRRMLSTCPRTIVESRYLMPRCSCAFYRRHRRVQCPSLFLFPQMR